MPVCSLYQRRRISRRVTTRHVPELLFGTALPIPRCTMRLVRPARSVTSTSFRWFPLNNSSLQRAVLFDMDGVLVDSEREWHRSGAAFLGNLYGSTLRARMGDTVGLSVDDEYDLAASRGFAMDRQAFYDAYDRQAAITYAQARVTPGLDAAFQDLCNLGYVVGVVTASRRPWLDTLLSRMRARHCVTYSLALGERRELRSKPHPDGYLAAMQDLQVAAHQTYIVEDSNPGIRAGKQAGGYVIGFQQHLLDGYVQSGADAYANTMEDVLRIVRNLHND